MQPIDPSATVASFVLRHPAAARTFERFGIDYCCRGRVALTQACREVAVPLRDVVLDLEYQIGQPDAVEPPVGDVDALIDYILERHHKFARDELDRLVPLAAKVVRTHGERHAELREVCAVLGEIAGDLLPHMRKEELVLFPLLRFLHAGGTRGRSPERPIEAMQREHDKLGKLLFRLRDLTSNYVPPRDGCASYRALYHGLGRLSADLQQHVHLENNVLFSRATPVHEDA